MTLIQETPCGFFVQAPGAIAPQGPCRTREEAERVLANIAARAKRRASPKPKRETSAEIEPRVVKAPPANSLPRCERRGRIVKKRRELRARSKREKAQERKAGLKAAQEVQAAQEAEAV